MIVLAATLVLMSGPSEWKRWGEEALDLIRRDLYLPEQRLYAEDSTKKQVAFNWPCGVMLSALNGGARLNAKYKPWLREYVEAMRKYWHPEGGFDVLPLPKPKDRYYDDNAWMAIALIETSEVLGEKMYLDWAEETTRFVLSGEDDKLGGGIYWRENEKNSKNTCSNGPAAYVCLSLYQKTGKPEYLQAGKRLYSWTRRNLQDPGTNLFWDNIGINAKIDRTTWSYNTALMMRARAALKRLDPRFDVGPDPDEAARLKWLDPTTGLIKDDMAFAHLFFEALSEHSFQERGVYLEGLRSRARDSSGRYGKRWDSIATEPRPVVRLIDQASAARAYFVAAAMNSR